MTEADYLAGVNPGLWFRFHVANLILHCFHILLNTPIYTLNYSHLKRRSEMTVCEKKYDTVVGSWVRDTRLLEYLIRISRII